MRIPLFIAGIVAAGLTATAPPFQEEISVKKATPIITVDDVDACLPFWAERLGFTITATVPHEDATGFAMLSKGGVELMYQSRASIDADLGASGAPEGLGTELTRGTVTLFGLDMPRHVLDVRQQLGFMPEQEAVSPKIKGALKSLPGVVLVEEG